jgi:hypothetical protein
MPEYAIIEIDCQNYQSKILKIECDEKTALEYLNKYINNNEEYNDENLHMKYIESERCISIYRRNWLFRKTLLYRYFLEGLD